MVYNIEKRADYRQTYSDAKVMVPSTRPSDPQSQSSHAQKVISLILSDDATIASFTAATLIGRALNVYARASENRKICQNDMIDHGSTSHLQSSLIEASDAYQAPAQALMTIGLSYVTKAMRKLGHQMQLSGFSATDGVINTVLELAVCEVMMGETSKGETHCQGKCFVEHSSEWLCSISGEFMADYLDGTGLSSMIKTRGGPSSVPSFLMDSVFLTDMHMATISHRKPSYPLLDAHRPSLETLLPEACRSFGLPPPHCQILGISDKLLEILDQGFATALAQLQDLVNYTDAFEKTLQQVPVDLRKLYVSKTFAWSMVYSPASTRPTTTSTMRSKAFAPLPLFCSSKRAFRNGVLTLLLRGLSRDSFKVHYTA